MVVISSLLHILHGNRPYALSRKSHPITPYAPSGEFEYRNLICRLVAKVDKCFSQKLPETFISGQIYLQDSTLSWPDEIQDIDAIITSPPFLTVPDSIQLTGSGCGLVVGNQMTSK